MMALTGPNLCRLIGQLWLKLLAKLSPIKLDPRNKVLHRKNSDMQKAIAIIAVLLFGLSHPEAQNQSNSKAESVPGTNKLDSKWSELVGEWAGEGTGNPGNGAGTSSFQFDLQKQVLGRSHSEYPAAGGRPATVHDDLMVIYAGTGEESRAIYFDNEGHVIEYAATRSVAGDTLTFLSKPTSGTPQFRLTYKKVDAQTMTVEFEMAPPGKLPSSRTSRDG
jgi:hypothetical protein